MKPLMELSASLDTLVPHSAELFRAVSASTNNPIPTGKIRVVTMPDIVVQLFLNTVCIWGSSNKLRTFGNFFVLLLHIFCTTVIKPPDIFDAICMRLFADFKSSEATVIYSSSKK